VRQAVPGNIVLPAVADVVPGPDGAAVREFAGELRDLARG
jgi:hypothetical protein